MGAQEMFKKAGGYSHAKIVLSVTSPAESELKDLLRFGFDVLADLDDGVPPGIDRAVRGWHPRQNAFSILNRLVDGHSLAT
jgi:hypothetical protein